MNNKLKAGLVLTTINEPHLLDGYFENFRRFDHLDQVIVFLIVDKKTPASVYEQCKALKRKGLDIRCPTLEEQEVFISKLGRFAKLVPYNSDNRRNIGFLMALEAGVDFLISIDDDNFCLPNDDFFAEHSVVARGVETFETVHSFDGWFNICELLSKEPNYQVYPRGFPYHSRHRENQVSYKIEQGLIRVNAGLWLSEPDLDAMTWLVAPVRARSFLGPSVVLGADTWTPINTQNTAVHRDLIPAYYFIRMGYPLAGIRIDRYGDIFSGYFVQSVARHLGYYVRVGTPIVEHRRNAHNYLKDAYSEFACIWVLEDLTAWLRELQLEGSTCEEAYVCLSYAIEDAVESFSGFIWTDATRGYFHQMAYCMRAWVEACKVIRG